MRDFDRASEFIEKANKWLSWSDSNYQEMLEHGKRGRIQDVERAFVSLLLLLDSIHQSLVDAAKKLDEHAWRNRLNELRATDPLLRYLWNARRSEAHDALVKWQPSMKQIQAKVILPETARIIQLGSTSEYMAIQRLFFRAFEVATEEEFFEKVKIGFIPTREAQLNAGIEVQFSLDSLSLNEFKIGSDKIAPPEKHLDKVLPPSATEAARFAIEFYRNMLDELKARSIKA